MTEAETVETTDEEITDTDVVDDTTDEVVDEDPSAGLKKALAAERKARREAERKEREAAQRLADRDKEPAEQAIEQARREAREEAQTAFNQRLVQAELKAALAGKVSNLGLALKVIDSSVIDVDATGEVDPLSVTDAIEAALREYPELKPAEAKKFAGTADQGTKGKATRPQQLTREELKSLTPEQVVAAEAAGQLDQIMGR
jgi:hypothetical protein